MVVEGKKERIRMTTGIGGLFHKAGKWFKVLKHQGVHNIYEEIDLEEYDKRVCGLAKKIVSSPNVDLTDILRDALYDLPLERLGKIEEMLKQEMAKATPSVKTTKRDRGTCVNLAIGGKFAVELRE